MGSKVAKKCYQDGQNEGARSPTFAEGRQKVLEGRQLWPKVANSVRKVAKTTHTKVGDLGDLRPKPRLLSPPSC
jgi:hypothetical protein